MDTPYRDRAEAGVALAHQLAAYGQRPDVTVLGLVRGGVPVAAEVARRLAAPLDVLVVRKLGVPQTPEVAFGAVGPGGVLVINDRIAGRLDQDAMAEVVRRESTELERRDLLYRAGRSPLTLAGRTAVIVDDGLATGASARAAAEVARRLGAQRVVVAVPVGSPEAYEALSAVADEVVCPRRPADFSAVSRHYVDFHEVSDQEVTTALRTG